jgi:hypothetical protein
MKPPKNAPPSTLSYRLKHRGFTVFPISPHCAKITAKIASSAAEDHQQNRRDHQPSYRQIDKFPSICHHSKPFLPEGNFHSGHPQAFVGHLHRHPSSFLTADKLYEMTNSSNKNKCFSFFFNLNLFSFFFHILMWLGI